METLYLVFTIIFLICAYGCGAFLATIAFLKAALWIYDYTREPKKKYKVYGSECYGPEKLIGESHSFDEANNIGYRWCSSSKEIWSYRISS